MDNDKLDINEIMKDAGVNDATTKAFLAFAKALNNTNSALKEVAKNTKETADYFKSREGFSFAKDLEATVCRIKEDIEGESRSQTKNLTIKFFAWLAILLTLMTSLFMFINDKKIDSIKEEIKHLNINDVERVK